MPFAVFFLSTGRCGTQWLAAQLQRAYADRLLVEHEPLHNFYSPRRMLRVHTLADLDAETAAPILTHVAEIENCLAERSYIECGHPCWSALPALADRFQGRIRIVHLARHPVPTAYSWLTHQAYRPPILPYLPVKVLLAPTDPGVLMPEYAERWEEMTPFEKCLYYWGEVNLFGLKQQEALAVPWLRLTYEELFFANGLERLLSFLDLPPAESLPATRAETVDKFSYLTQEHPDPALMARHPRILEIADRLGYNAAEFDLKALQRRYQGFQG